MEVRALRWVGVATDRFDEMSAFLRDVLRLRVELDEPTTIEVSTAGGDRVQLMAPGHRYHALFSREAHGPVPLFEVDDVHAWRHELAARGVEIVGATQRDGAWEWIDVRAPDGNLYELASRLPAEP